MNEFIRQWREKYPGAYDDLNDVELLRLIHKKFYDDMSYGDYLDKLEKTHGRSNTGPTPPPQPPFPTLPPMVGGALDALVAFGTGAGLGLPLLSGDTRAYTDELMERAPGTTLATAGAGGAMAGVAGGAALMARTAAGAANPHGFRIAHQAGPGLLRRGAGLASDAIRNRFVRGAVGGGIAYDYLRRMFGG